MNEYKIKALFRENAAQHAEFSAKLEQLEAENTAEKAHLEALAAAIDTFKAQLNRLFILLEATEEEIQETAQELKEAAEEIKEAAEAQEIEEENENEN
jgi:glutamate-1-semialdehyde aminotransferase